MLFRSEAVIASPSITVVEHATVVDLHMVDGRVAGVLVDHGDGDITLYPAGAVVLATGGIGRLYECTTNPPEATADGLALAARAGATLRDLEFVQFHPTALAAEGADPLPLLTEALRGEGAHLVDESGRRFVLDAHPDGELAPRDVVARAIARHRLAGHRTFLQIGPRLQAEFADHFPTVLASCLAHGVDPRHEPIPTSPAHHYHMGGAAPHVHFAGPGGSRLELGQMQRSNLEQGSSVDTNVNQQTWRCSDFDWVTRR